MIDIRALNCTTAEGAVSLEDSKSLNNEFSKFLYSFVQLFMKEAQIVYKIPFPKFFI